MPIDNEKLVNLGDAQLLYRDLRERVMSVGDSKAPAINKTINTEAAVQEFLDGSDGLPMDIWAVINPVQDLHGYEKPWAAGMGKNLISNDMFELGGIASAGGNSSSDSEIRQKTKMTVTPGTTYSVSCLNEGLSYFYAYFYNGNTMDSRIDETPFTVPANVDGMRIKFGFGENPRPAIDDLIIQLEIGSTVTSWSPYENICPISGWTGCKITRTGKNLCDPSLFAANRISVSSGVYTFTLSGYDADLYSGLSGVSHVIPSGTPLPFLQAGTYVFSYKLTSGGAFNSVYIVDKNGNRTSLGATRVEDSDYKAFKFTMPKAGFITICRGGNSNPTVFSEPQIEVGEARTAYEPYTGNTYNITFPSEAGTVYGGELTVNKDGSGSLILKYFYLKIDKDSSNLTFNSSTGQLRKGSLSPQTSNTSAHMCDQYTSYSGTFANLPNNRFMTSSSTLAIKDTRFTSLQEWIDHLEEIGGIEFCFYRYSFSDPIPLNPGQVRTLLGYNVVFADTGNIKSVGYSADTKAYIDNLFNSILTATGVSF